jgi:hypothetical protein
MRLYISSYSSDCACFKWQYDITLGTGSLKKDYETLLYMISMFAGIIMPNRNYQRKMHPRSAVDFNYRL